MADALQEALRKLPHGPEFRFLDRLLSLVPGKEGVGEYQVRGDEFFLRGHFAGDPLVPGVVLVEAAAQLAGVVAQNDPEIQPLLGLKLTALRAVKIMGTARPGEAVRLQARITGRLGGLVVAKAQAFVGERLVLDAELTLSGTVPPAAKLHVQRDPPGQVTGAALAAEWPSPPEESSARQIGN